MLRLLAVKRFSTIASSNAAPAATPASIPSVNLADKAAESQLPLMEAIHVIRARSLGYQVDSAEQGDALALHIHCKQDDQNVRELRGSIMLPNSFMKTRTCVIAIVF